NAEGRLFCLGAALDQSRMATLTAQPGTRPWLERVVADRRIVVGDYRISATTGKPVVTVAQPLIESSGRIRRVLAAAVDLDQLNRIAAASTLPVGATLTLVNRQRTIVARYPDGKRWLGTTLPADVRVAGLDEHASTEPFETADVDGVVRLHITAP